MRIEVIDSPSESLRESVNAELRNHNRASNPEYWEEAGRPENSARELNLFAFDESGGVIGGLFASTRFSWLKIEIMATSDGHRGRGVGRELVGRAEAVARDRGCQHAYVDTMEYQAPKFYERLGYRLVGTLPDWDSHGHAKFFYVKELK